MTWNYRIVKYRGQHKGKRWTMYGIREVYYNSKGKADGYTASDKPVTGETPHEVLEILSMMLRDAIRHEVIDEREMTSAKKRKK